MCDRLTFGGVANRAYEIILRAVFVCSDKTDDLVQV